MKLIVFDCDSTLSSIEGIDELARSQGPEVFAKVEALTNGAMNGEVALDEVFARRLDIIRPTKEVCDEVASLYIETLEPTAKSTLQTLREQGWKVVILSGGFKTLIEPLAQELHIDHIEAVPLHLSDQGEYISFDASYPTTYNGGKPEIIKQLKEKYSPSMTVMVGDGISDLETKDEVDLFVGFGRYTARAKVQEASEHFIYSLDQLLEIID